jgi:hypothetical protein
MIPSRLLTSDGSDRCTAYHQANKIVRTGDGLWVTWLDAEYRCVIADVAPDGRVRGVVPVSQGFDNHCGGAITRTPDGLLHFVSGSHHRGFIYRYSATPMKPESWSLPQGVGYMPTYPSLVHDLNGTLHLAHRRGAPDNVTPWGINYATKAAGELWAKSSNLVRMPAPDYAYPTNALVAAPDGTVHLLIEWYKTWPNHVYRAHTVALTHLERSPDGIWRHTDGREVKQFAVALEDTALLLPRAAGNTRPGNIALLRDGRPCFCAWDQDSGETILAIRQPDRAWKFIDVGGPVAASDPGGVFNGQPQVAVNARGEILLACSRAAENQWGHPTSRVAVGLFDAEGRLLRFDAVEKDAPDTPDWLPSVEKPAPGLFPEQFHLLFQRGRRGEGCVNTTRCAVRLASIG